MTLKQQSDSTENVIFVNIINDEPCTFEPLPLFDLNKKLISSNQIGQFV